MSQTKMFHSSLTLWDIEHALVELMEAREEAQDDETRAAIDQALGEYCQREIEKVDGIRGYLRHCSMMAETAKQEALLQRDRSNAWQARKERLERFCLIALEMAGKKSAEGRTGKLLVKTNGGKQAMVIDESKLAEPYLVRVVSVQANKELIRSELEAGESIYGAYLEPRGSHLEVK